MDGVEYHIVMRFDAIAGAKRAGSLPTSSPNRTTVAPCFMGTCRSRIERSKWKGAWDEKRSSSVGSSASPHQSTNAAAWRCESVTPFGVPVEPDV
jgi:hypothetical protein